MGGEPGEVLCAHSIEAGIGQTDRVDHSATELSDARRRCARPGLDAHGLGDEPAEPFEIHDLGELAAVARSAGSEDDRILKL